MVCFQESKLKAINYSVINSLWSCNRIGWLENVADGASGGILILWENRVIHLVDQFVGNYPVACRLKNIDDDLEWAFAIIYGPNLDSESQHLWKEIAGILSHWDLPRCIGGGF